MAGTVHSRDRDRAVIGHHYDLSNAFYALILDPSMAYSSAYYDRPEMSLAQAQQAKLDLICRKLELKPDQRLLDVGCGWGSLSLHAAEHFGARVLGVTISERQQEFINRRIAERDLGDRVEVRLQDYRELREQPFDAVGSIEMGEHVGEENYPAYLDVLFGQLRPDGRLLLQQMSRRADAAPGGGAFIENYIAPDMHMRPVGQTIGQPGIGGVRDTRGGGVARALRPHRRRLAGQLRGPLRPGGRAGRGGGRPGLAAVPGRRRPELRRGPDGRRADPRDPAAASAATTVASFPAAPFWHALALVALALLVVLAATFAIGRVVGKHSVIDTAWGLLFCAAGGTAFLASTGHGNPARRVLLLVLVLVWGLRLAGHIARRSIGKPEDPRYEQLLAGKSAGYALLLVYGLQGLLAFLIAMPVVVGSFSTGPITALAWLGVLSWLVGVCFEAIGDWQLERYKADPNRGQVLDSGLWRYTRHPNYFGDACVWVGIFWWPPNVGRAC